MPKSIVIKDSISLTLNNTAYTGQLSYDPEFKMLWLGRDHSQSSSVSWSMLAISREEPYNSDDDTVAILDTDGPDSVVSQLVDQRIGTMVSETVLTPEFLPNYTRLYILRINPELLAAAA